MAYIAEDFLTPALVKISEYLKLPSIVASVTLLAFANGAGDVITSIASTEKIVDLGSTLSSLYGSGFFV